MTVRTQQDNNPFDALKRLLKERTGGDDALAYFEGSNQHVVLDNLAAYLIKLGTLSRSIFPVTINYGLSLKEMIAAANFDGEISEEITSENFHLSGKGKLQVNTLPIDISAVLPGHPAEKRIASQGHGLTQIEHILAFAARYRDFQREHLVVAQGSSCTCKSLGKGLWVPALSGRGGKRSLVLISATSKPEPRDRYLVIPQLPTL